MSGKNERRARQLAALPDVIYPDDMSWDMDAWERRPYDGPTLHEVISASHSMLLAAHVAGRSPPRPRFVHCFGCRVPVTPSGRRALITEPPTGNHDDVERLCEMLRYRRIARSVR